MAEPVHESQLTMRADRSGYIIFSVLWTPIIIINMLALRKMCAVQYADTQTFLSNISGPMFLISLLGFVFLWLSAFKLIITKTDIQYKTLFSRTRRLTLHDIQYARYAMGNDRDSDVLKPFVRLELHCKPGKSSRAPLIINAKVFSLADLRKLKQLLQETGITFR